MTRQKSPQADPAGRPKRPPQGARADKMIGYAALGLGLAALLVVGGLAVRHFAPGIHFISETGEDSYRKQGRAPRLTPAMVEGDWTASFLDYTALFQLRDGTYQLLAMRSFPTAPRYYARGTYRLDGAFMTLTPDNSHGSPRDDDPNPKNRYLHLGHRPATIELRFHNGGQLWFSGPADPDYPHRSPAHTLILYSGQDYIYWTPKD